MPEYNQYTRCEGRAGGGGSGNFTKAEPVSPMQIGNRWNLLYGCVR